MTRYAVNTGTRELTAVQDGPCGRHQARTVLTFPPGVAEEHQLELTAAMGELADALWRTYTDPGGAPSLATPGFAVPAHDDGYPDSRDRVAAAISAPETPGDHGTIVRFADPVVESSHSVGRALLAVGAPPVAEAVLEEMKGEVDAVRRAELGDLTGRAGQAVTLTRCEASPAQVAYASAMFADNPFGNAALFADFEPAAAAVAGASWLAAAAEVAAGETGQSWAGVLFGADDIEPVDPLTGAALLTMLSDDRMSAQEAVTTLVRQANAVGTGVSNDVDEIAERVDEVLGYGNRSGAQSQVQLCALDPQRPALDLLESIIRGIYGCYLVWRDYNWEGSDEDGDDEDGDDDLDREEARLRALFAGEMRRARARGADAYVVD